MPFIEVIPLKRPHVFMAHVFNAAQIDGLPAYQKPEYTWDPIQEAERIVRASQADIAHDSLSDPYYDLLTDSIHLLGRECFPFKLESDTPGTPQTLGARLESGNQ
jgi:putative DNA primase/helicase